MAVKLAHELQTGDLIVWPDADLQAAIVGAVEMSAEYVATAIDYVRPGSLWAVSEVVAWDRDAEVTILDPL